MSYSIWLEVDTGGPEPAQVGTDWNYTGNCARMWEAAGANLAEFDGKLADECLPVLQAAIDELRANPGYYTAMNPPNGWGSYDSLVPTLEALAATFALHPLAKVRVTR